MLESTQKRGKWIHVPGKKKPNSTAWKKLNLAEDTMRKARTNKPT